MKRDFHFYGCVWQQVVRKPAKQCDKLKETSGQVVGKPPAAKEMDLLLDGKDC